jgi:pyrroline-5-carboxylate reductase
MKLGVIGYGNIARALVEGVVKAGYIDANDIYISTLSIDQIRHDIETLGCHALDTNKAVAEKVDFLVLAVKPYQYEAVLKDIQSALPRKTVIVSVAAGVTLDMMEAWTDDERKIIRTMPNTPMQVGLGMIAVTPNRQSVQAEVDFVVGLFSSVGRAVVIDETKMEAVIGASGSSPAFVYMMIEALADGAVLKGLPRDQAMEFAAQAVKGAAEMVLETGRHPGLLKDQVCSPGGTTIEGVSALEAAGFRTAVIEAVRRTIEKAEALKS